MALQWADLSDVGMDDKGEAAHFAQAAARVLAALTTSQVKRCGEDLMDVLDRHVPVTAIGRLADRAKPTSAEIRSIARQLQAKAAKPTELDLLLGWVGELFGLDARDIAILSTFARWGKFDAWRELVRRAPMSCSNLTPAVVARLARLSTHQVEQALMPGARLMSCRLIHDDGDGEYGLSRLLKRLIRSHAKTPQDMLSWLMPAPEPGVLTWDDFAHLEPLRTLALKVLTARQPVSILLFGEPGTGKTEFARTLAAQARSGAVFAGLADEGGNEPARAERLDHLMALRVMCRHRRDRIIVVDEADDVLVLGEHKGSSKQWINRLVEAPEVSTIWIINRRSRLDAAVLRRMTLAIGFDRPRFAVRERVVRRTADAADVPLEMGEVQCIAAIKAAPAVIASGMRAASLANGGAQEATIAIHSVMRALGHSGAPELPRNSSYDPELSQADIDLGRLAEQLIASPERGWSLLLSGPSGTGKSAYARYLADRMGLEVEERRCSDLVSPYVGETEQNIAEAFAEAAERGSLLLIDEIDSFLHRREAGQRSWEVSKVNEMLVQLEHLRTPFVATTNLADQLDAAAQRRFTIRAHFRAMTQSQVARLFQARFGAPWPADCPIHDGQTPGDFAVVAHRARLLGECEAAVLVKWLRDEIETRGDQVRGIMGFTDRRQPKPGLQPAHRTRTSADGPAG